ncbi:host specificity factor TipJ family phage tail protein [Pigmentiphaga litoralis]|uniref:host specificity factor TipJ family phage tail protein n=1 Tax=Pigmentiphaga litoralis TaxID=516702 RepID=UPI00167B5F45|nr:host specificity factor TipJ family phage tail protein [Pigmentiphaga litoralis]
MAHLIVCRDPFRPQVGREVVQVCRRTRVDTLLRGRGLIAGRGRKMQRRHPFIVVVNDAPLMQKDWGRAIAADDVCAVMLLPQGGGGSNPLQVVLQVALIAASIYAPYLAGLTMTLANGAVVASTAGALLSAGVMLAGSLLINALLPPPKAASATAREAASPTYTVGAQGNAARLLEAIPVLYGRFRLYPDFAAQPYVENIGNEQYLYQLFCLTQGEIEIDKIRIEDTDITSFGEVQYEVIKPGGAVTLFPDNVVTSDAVQNLELLAANEANVGDGWKGPYVVNPANTEANWIAIDFSYQGLFYANDSGGLDALSMTFEVQAQRVDGTGAGAGDWLAIGGETLTMATDKAQVISRRYPVPPGRYQVRVRRVGDKALDSRASNTLYWAGMRAYLPSQSYYGDVTLLAMVIKATNNLNGNTARRVNVLGTRKLPVWDGATWSEPVATRNPAWAIADAFRNTTYGRGLPDKRINLDELLRLAGVWAARGDYCDGVFDTTSTLWDAVTQIARVGRAVPMYYAGVIDVVRTEPKTIREAVFTPHNMAARSFAIDYAFPDVDAADHVVVEYTDPQTWKPAQVPCILQGGTANKAANVQFWGITNRDQAWREGISMAAANRDQRRAVSFATEMEGNIPRYGGFVAVSHDVPQWGLSGQVEQFDPVSGLLRTSEPLQWFGAESHYLALRRRNGSADGPYLVTPGPDEFSCVVVAAEGVRRAMYVSDGRRSEPTIYVFGPGERRGLDCVMLAAEPDEDGKVKLRLTNYAPSVHEAEQGGSAPPPAPASLLPGVTAAPVVASVSVVGGSVNGQQTVTATAARGAERYEFEASSDNLTWALLGSATTPSISTTLSVGTWHVRARAIGAMPGPWAYWTGVISEMTMPPPAPTLTLQEAWAGKAVRVNISNARGDFRTIRVWTGGVMRREFNTTNFVIEWTYDDAVASSAVSPEVTFTVLEVNVAGPSAEASITVTNSAPAAPGGTVVQAQSGLALRLVWSTASDAARHYITAPSVGDFPGFNWSGLPNGEPYVDVPLPLGTNGDVVFSLRCVDLWGNSSPTTTVQYQAPPDTGGGD